MLLLCVCFFFIAFMSFSFATVENRSDELSSPVQKLFICTFKILFGFVCRLFFVVFFFQNTRNDPSRYIAPLFVSVRSTHKHSERKKKNIHYLKWMRYLFDLISPSWCMKCTEKESTNIFQLFHFSMTFSRFLHFIFGFNELYNTITHRMYVDVNFDVIFIKHLNFAYRREQTKPFDKQMNNK